MNNQKRLCLTCDVEVFSEEHVDELKKILSILNNLNVKVTFFVEIVETNETFLKKNRVFEDIEESKLHEIGLHIHWKNSWGCGLKSYTHDNFRHELKNSLRLLPELSQFVKSFRAGGLCCSATMLEVLSEFNFTVDSSVAARLNEPVNWHQGHKQVPYEPWYFPEKGSYWKPASNSLNKIDILEIPVTRLNPSWIFWKLCTLQPGNLFNKLIIRQQLSRQGSNCLLTMIMHSWGSGRYRGKKFTAFTNQLISIINYLRNEGFCFLTLQEVRRNIITQEEPK